MIIKTKVLLPHAWCFCSQNLLIYLDFKYFDIERTMLNVIPETRRVQLI